MKLFNFLLLILAIIANVKGSYSIDSFITELQNNGYYDIIAQVNRYYGNDVAIEMCKMLTESFSCEELVRVYLGIPPKPPTPHPGGPSIVIPTVVEILLQNMDILEDNMTQEEIDYLINKYK